MLARARTHMRTHTHIKKMVAKERRGQEGNNKYSEEAPGACVALE